MRIFSPTLGLREITEHHTSDDIANMLKDIVFSEWKLAPILLATPARSLQCFQRSHCVQLCFNLLICRLQLADTMLEDPEMDDEIIVSPEGFKQDANSKVATLVRSAVVQFPE